MDDVHSVTNDLAHEVTDGQRITDIANHLGYKLWVGGDNVAYITWHRDPRNGALSGSARVAFIAEIRAWNMVTGQNLPERLPNMRGLAYGREAVVQREADKARHPAGKGRHGLELVDEELY